MWVAIFLLLLCMGAHVSSDDVSECQCGELEKAFEELRRSFEDLREELNLPKKRPKDCKEASDNIRGAGGVNKIFPFGDEESIEVYCDIATDGGGWLVIQRRMDGSVNFTRDWKEYVNGFGDRSGEFWLGLENLHRLTTASDYELRFDMEDFEGQTKFASYSAFAIGEGTNYTITKLGDYHGDAGDNINGVGARFSTWDKDQDNSTGSCATRFKGGWWYERCHWANPNGFYYNGKHDSFADGINWRDFRGYHYSLERMEMKIRKI